MYLKCLDLLPLPLLQSTLIRKLDALEHQLSDTLTPLSLCQGLHPPRIPAPPIIILHPIYVDRASPLLKFLLLVELLH
jgi:hypothetical protein